MTLGHIYMTLRQLHMTKRHAVRIFDRVAGAAGSHIEDVSMDATRLEHRS
jgi:hypothetical protein